jgi:DNA polymerase-3 subunit epsilon
MQPDYEKDKRRACQWARDLIEGGNFVILDTETTGLENARICQIGILAANGRVLLDALVNPRRPIEAGAMAVHGISQKEADSAPPIQKLLGAIKASVEGKTVVIFNRAYDYSVIQNHVSDYAFNSWATLRDSCDWECAMLPYSAYIGEWNDYRVNYKWQKLPAGDHSAIGDCRSTLAIIKRMAKNGPWSVRHVDGELFEVAHATRMTPESPNFPSVPVTACNKKFKHRMCEADASALAAELNALEEAT